MAEKFSRHVNEQFRWTEALLSRLRENLRNARHFKIRARLHARIGSRGSHG
jgi:hypothetical protein